MPPFYVGCHSNCGIDQFPYIKIQPKTNNSMRLWGIATEFLGFILQSLVLKSIVLGSILIYQNLSKLQAVA